MKVERVCDYCKKPIVTTPWLKLSPMDVTKLEKPGASGWGLSDIDLCYECGKKLYTEFFNCDFKEGKTNSPFLNYCSGEGN